MKTYAEAKLERLQEAWELGHELLEKKQELHYGEFIQWCRQNHPNMSQRTLNRYMRIAKSGTLTKEGQWRPFSESEMRENERLERELATS